MDYLGVGKSNNEPPFLEGLDHLLMTIDDFGGSVFFGFATFDPNYSSISWLLFDISPLHPITHYIPINVNPGSTNPWAV